jgi:uncharacterized lipoprotein YajG
MSRILNQLIIGMILILFLAACATKQEIIIDTESVSPGTQVSNKGVKLPLTVTVIEIRQQSPEAKRMR